MTRYSLFLIFLFHGQITAIDNQQGKVLHLAEIKPSKLKAFKEAFAKTMAPGESIENIRYICRLDDGTLQGFKYKYTNFLETAAYLTNNFKKVRAAAIKHTNAFRYTFTGISLAYQLLAIYTPSHKFIGLESIVIGVAKVCFLIGRSFRKDLRSMQKAGESQFLKQRNSDSFFIDDCPDNNRLFGFHFNLAHKIKSAGLGVASGALHYLACKYFDRQ